MAHVALKLIELEEDDAQLGRPFVGLEVVGEPVTQGRDADPEQGVVLATRAVGLKPPGGDVLEAERQRRHSLVEGVPEVVEREVFRIVAPLQPPRVGGREEDALSVAEHPYFALGDKRPRVSDRAVILRERAGGRVHAALVGEGHRRRS